MFTNNPTKALLLAATLAAPTTGKTPSTTPISAAELAAWEAPNPYANPLASEFSAMSLAVLEPGPKPSSYSTGLKIDYLVRALTEATSSLGTEAPKASTPSEPETK